MIIAGPLCDLCGANVVSDSEGIKKNKTWRVEVTLLEAIGPD